MFYISSAREQRVLPVKGGILWQLDLFYLFLLFNVWLLCGKVGDVFPFSFHINLSYTACPKGLCWLLREAISPSQMAIFLFSGLSCTLMDQVLSVCSFHNPTLQKAEVHMALLVRARDHLGPYPITASCQHTKKSKTIQLYFPNIFHSPAVWGRRTCWPRGDEHI